MTSLTEQQLLAMRTMIARTNPLYSVEEIESVLAEIIANDCED